MEYKIICKCFFRLQPHRESRLGDLLSTWTGCNGGDIDDDDDDDAAMMLGCLQADERGGLSYSGIVP